MLTLAKTATLAVRVVLAPLFIVIYDRNLNTNFTLPPHLPFSNKTITKLYWPHLLSTLESIHFSSFLIPWRSRVGKLCPWAKSSLLPVFVNKALLDASYVHSFMDYLWLLYATTAEMTTCNRNHMACKAKIYSLGLYRKSLGTLVLMEGRGGRGGDRWASVLPVSTSVLSIPVSTLLKSELTNMQIRWHHYLLKAHQRPNPLL